MFPALLLRSVFNYFFPVSVIKYPGKINLRGKAFIPAYSSGQSFYHGEEDVAEGRKGAGAGIGSELVTFPPPSGTQLPSSLI